MQILKQDNKLIVPILKLLLRKIWYKDLFRHLQLINKTHTFVIYDMIILVLVLVFQPKELVLFIIHLFKISCASSKMIETISYINAKS